MKPRHERQTLACFSLWMTLLVAVIVPVVGAPLRASAVDPSTCGIDALQNTQDVLCGNGICTATLVRVTAPIDVTSGGCQFDLGGRALSFEKTFQMTGLGFIRVINAGNITLTSTGKLKARGDFVKPNGYIIGGGLISLTSSGTIDIDGLIDVAGDSAGTVRLVAAQDIMLQPPPATIEGPGISSFADVGDRFTDGGELDATAQAGSITINGEITLSGQNGGTGGIVDFTAARNLTMTRSFNVSGGGGDGGSFTATVGDHITLTNGTINADSTVGGGYGGVVSLDAGADYLGGVVAGGTIDIDSASLLMRGSATDTSGGDGGELELLALGRIRLFGLGMVIRASAATNFDGSGGLVTIDSGDNNTSVLRSLDGDLEIDGLIFMQSGSTGGGGGTIDLSAGRDLVFSADLDNSGTDAGGDVTGTAGRAITLNGAITTRGTSAGGEGGYVDFEAGLASDEGALGSLVVQKNIVGTSGADHGSGQSITLAGCGLTVSPNVKIDGTGGVNPITNMLGGSDIELIARRPMQLGGSSQYVAPPGGSVTTTHPLGANPVIAPGVVFNPPRLDRPIVAGPYPNCPVCGDGIKQFGEGCDDGSLGAGDGCSPTCVVETGWICSGSPSVCGPRCGDGLILAGEQCDDGNLVAGDGCTPTCTVDSGWTCTGQPSACIQTCGDGVVLGGEQCDDGNLVNGDDCDNNCTFTACGNGVVTAGEACDDGNTQNGDCCSSSCTVEAAGSACASDGNVCSDDVCNGAGTCTHVPNTAPCASDGNVCSDDVCNGAGTCTHVPNTAPCASDGNVCSDDVCNGAGTCTHVPNTAPCNDGSACTPTDTCQGGICVGTNPVICTASDQCHVAGTCAPATGTCSNPVHTNGAACSDGNACTRTDTCQVGVCTGANPLVCTALDQCHLAGACDTGTGVCSNPPKADNTSCNDAKLCTQSDTCQLGVCGGIPVVCTASDQCHVAGSCAPATGLCSNPAGPNGTSCNDGNACTRADVCSAGTCLGDSRICGDGIIQGSCGEVCDDGNLVSGDDCDANCTLTACGNGIVTALEACDGGDLADGDGCSSTCAVEAGWGCTGSPSLCSEICGDGIKTPGEACDDGNLVARDGCSPTCTLELCSAAPVEGCRKPVEAGKASIGLKDKLGTAKDTLTWKWTHGAATTHADLGNPRFNTDYAICLYDEKAGTPSLKLSLTAPHAGFCGSRPCWKDSSTGFAYSNSFLVPDGKLKILLKEGLAGSAKITVTGKGTNLKMPTLPLDQAGRVRVQVKNSNGVCWEADYSTNNSNLPNQFNARSD